MQCERSTVEIFSLLVFRFAIWNTIMGSSLLAMPWGIDRAGLATGIFLIILMGAICLLTAYLLLRVQQLHGIAFMLIVPTIDYKVFFLGGGNADWEVADLAGALLGPHSERLAKTFSLVVLLGANIVYWILMSNFLYHTVDYLYGKFHLFTYSKIMQVFFFLHFRNGNWSCKLAGLEQCVASGCSLSSKYDKRCCESVG